MAATSRLLAAIAVVLVVLTYAVPLLVLLGAGVFAAGSPPFPA